MNILRVLSVSCVLFTFSCVASGNSTSEANPNKQSEIDENMDLIPNTSRTKTDPGWSSYQVATGWVTLEALGQTLQGNRVIAETPRPYDEGFIASNAQGWCFGIWEIILETGNSTGLLGGFGTIKYDFVRPTGYTQRTVHPNSVLGTVVQQREYSCNLQIRSDQAAAFESFFETHINR